MRRTTSRAPRLLFGPLVLGILIMSSCASVPEEAVELSVVVGNRITAMQIAHEAFIEGYFRVTQERIEDFLQYRWIPTFLETFVRDSDIIDMLREPDPFSDEDRERLQEELKTLVFLQEGERQEVVSAAARALGDEERGRRMFQFAEAAQEQIEIQRRELLVPLDQLKAKLLGEVRASYTELIDAQNAVTAYLRSVRDVKVEEDRVLRRLDLLERRDRAVQSAVELSEQVERTLVGAERADQVMEKLEKLLGHQTEEEAPQTGEE